MHLQRVKIITETRRKKYKKSYRKDLTFYDKVLHLGDREFTEVQIGYQEVEIANIKNSIGSRSGDFDKTRADSC